MKRYFVNLLTALCGSDPYRQELDKLKGDMLKACENVRCLQESYYKEAEKAAAAEEMYGEAAKLIEKSDVLMTDYRKQLTSYQVLVDSLREYIREKDEMIGEMHNNLLRQADSYEKRVGDYSRTVACLQEKLGKQQNP